MKLTPLDIRKQQFKKVMRGYDCVEVDTFMEMLCNEFEEAARDHKDLRERVVELETQLKDYRQIEKTLQQTLLQAQETTGRTYEAARREAETIIRDADARSSRMLENSADKLSRMNAEIAELKGRKDSLIARLRLLLTSELDLIKVLESGPPEVTSIFDEPPGRELEARDSGYDMVLKSTADDSSAGTG